MSKRIAHLDVLGEVRRAMRILRRVERYMLQRERAERRADEKRKQNAELKALAERARAKAPRDERAAGELMAYGDPFRSDAP
jgi:hypothetical protein